MTQATNITIDNGEAAPVAKTFSVVKINPEMSIFSDRSSGVPVGFPTLNVSTKLDTSNAVSRTTYSVMLPVTATVNGQLSVARVLRAKVEYILPNDCTDSERKDLDAFVRNGLAHSVIQAAMRDFDPLY